jgi:hypothetical protein
MIRQDCFPAYRQAGLPDLVMSTEELGITKVERKDGGYEDCWNIL